MEREEKKTCSSLGRGRREGGEGSSNLSGLPVQLLPKYKDHLPLPNHQPFSFFQGSLRQTLVRRVKGKRAPPPPPLFFFCPGRPTGHSELARVTNPALDACSRTRQHINVTTFFVVVVVAGCKFCYALVSSKVPSGAASPESPEGGGRGRGGSCWSPVVARVGGGAPKLCDPWAARRRVIDSPPPPNLLHQLTPQNQRYYGRFARPLTPKCGPPGRRVWPTPPI